MHEKPLNIPDLVQIRATQLQPPPGWALLQRRFMEFTERAAELAFQKYCHADGTPHAVNDVDDVYEAHSMRGRFYALGGSERMLDIALRNWNAITRQYDDGVTRHPEDPVHPKFRIQLHNEYYNQSGPADWFHMGEGNQSFYDFGLADPANPVHLRRAKRFAAMYMDEDPEAPNYDPEHRIIRSPFHGSTGPRFQAELDFAKAALDPIYYPGGVARGHAQRSNLYPLVEDLEDNWFEEPARRDEILKLLEDVVLNGDIPDNLGATALVTHAYLFTGEEKYRRWVLDYTEAWMERSRSNGGIIPDNVGPTGKIGEQRQGQWWGGWYGWNSRNSARNALQAALIAGECSLLLSGDFAYLELLRSQIEKLLEHAKVRADGQLLVPTRMMPTGWDEYVPMGIQWLGRLYHASMDPRDRALIERLRQGERDRDWNQVEVSGDRTQGNLEARYQYYEGRNPDWPEAVQQADYNYLQGLFEFIANDPRDAARIAADNQWPPNPVVVKALTQVTTGAPPVIYNGGLLRATVRYFDAQQARPGLPPEVAALVDELDAGGVGIQLVNLSPTASRRLIVQGGAFGEHRFKGVKFLQGDLDEAAKNGYGWVRADRVSTEKNIELDAGHFAVELPPSSSIRLRADVSRFANPPSYNLPWG